MTFATPVDDHTGIRRPLRCRDRDELAEINRRSRQSRPARPRSIAWAYDRFGTDLVLAASFQDCVLIDLVYKTVPDVEVAFLDTQYHFAETLWYVDQVRRPGTTSTCTHSDPSAELDDLWLTDPDACCRGAQGRAAAAGARRQGGVDERAAARRRPRHGQQHPWSPTTLRRGPREGQPDRDVVRRATSAGYVRDHDLPVHPLADRGLRVDRLLAVHPARRRR